MASSTVSFASTVPSISASSSLPTPPPNAPKQVRIPNAIPSTANTRLSIAESSTHDPSLQFANLMWFKGTYNTQIFVGETEPADSVVKRFRRAVMQAGIISECRRRRYFETPQEVVKRKRQAAQRRRSKSRFFPRSFNDQKKDAQKNASKHDDDDDDNWEYEGMEPGF